MSVGSFTHFLIGIFVFLLLNFFFNCRFFLNFIYLCMYVCMYVCLSALGLCCCAQAFSSCGEQGLLFVEVRRLLIAVASLVAGHGLEVRGLQ